RATLALGFLLLAAFVGGDLAARARLPRIRISAGRVRRGSVARPGAARRSGRVALHRRRDARPDRSRRRRGAGTAIVARPAGRAGAPRGWRDRVPATRGCDGTPVREPVVPAHGAPVTGRRRGGGVGAGRAVGRVVA